MNMLLLVLSLVNWAFVYFDYAGGNVDGGTIFSTTVASILMTQFWYHTYLMERE